MKKLFLSVVTMLLFIIGASPAFAGDCTARTQVDWHATITSAVYLRDNCPEGAALGVIPAGEVVQILEVDKYNEFYLIKTSVGTGFVFESFLKDIVQSPLPGSEPTTFPDSIFIDLNPNHKYYDEIADVKEKGIVSGTPEGKILADNPVNRAELAKILVEATTEDTEIEGAKLSAGVYSDVQLGAWYTPYLEIARIKNIMTGDGSGTGITTVRPADNANGAEVAKMIVESFEIQVDSKPGTKWYEPYMAALTAINAMPYNNPNHVVTRGEMMFMVSRVLAQ
ncbi:MAG TPA: S-layer homology domain-containing protein [Candidatus Gracilibacteria bacterium]|nr:S-layer homology domain-containing protein [Candidatus Gracilibacteria bacterium]